jgi:SAM-dependent methyltransferase
LHLWIKAEHLGRYLFAVDFLRDFGPSLVVDAACGVGYGTAELVAVADAAVGIDADPCVLVESRQRFAASGARFVRADLETDDLGAFLGGELADAVVSFETLEHLLRPEAALARFAALLRAGGCLICSVPNAAHEARMAALLPRNRRHRQLFTFDSLVRLLDAAGFDVDYRLGQAWSNSILKRETDLIRRGVLEARLSSMEPVHEPSAIRWLSRVLAYPTAENVDWSYSHIAVATKR